jgi:hypothetical protein
VAPPEEAAELVAAVARNTLSPKSLERYTKAAGHATDRALEQRAQACQADTTPVPAAPVEPPARPYNLQFDGSMLRMRNATFREVKVGCLFDARAVARSRRAGDKCCTRTHSVVQRWLKRPGQRWTEAGARQILAARRLWCNRHSRRMSRPCRPSDT